MLHLLPDREGEAVVAVDGVGDAGVCGPPVVPVNDALRRAEERFSLEKRTDSPGSRPA